MSITLQSLRTTRTIPRHLRPPDKDKDVPSIQHNKDVYESKDTNITDINDNKDKKDVTDRRVEKDRKNSKDTKDKKGITHFKDNKDALGRSLDRPLVTRAVHHTWTVAATRLQAAYRGRRDRQKVVALRRKMSGVSRIVCKSPDCWAEPKYFRRTHPKIERAIRSAILIQKHVRGMIARRKMGGNLANWASLVDAAVADAESEPLGGEKGAKSDTSSTKLLTIDEILSSEKMPPVSDIKTMFLRECWTEDKYFESQPKIKTAIRAALIVQAHFRGQRARREVGTLRNDSPRQHKPVRKKLALTIENIEEETESLENGASEEHAPTRVGISGEESVIGSEKNTGNVCQPPVARLAEKNTEAIVKERDENFSEVKEMRRRRVSEEILGRRIKNKNVTKRLGKNTARGISVGLPSNAKPLRKKRSSILKGQTEKHYSDGLKSDKNRIENSDVALPQIKSEFNQFSNDDSSRSETVPSKLPSIEQKHSNKKVIRKKITVDSFANVRPKSCSKMPRLPATGNRLVKPEIEISGDEQSKAARTSKTGKIFGKSGARIFKTGNDTGRHGTEDPLTGRRLSKTGSDSCSSSGVSSDSTNSRTSLPGSPRLVRTLPELGRAGLHLNKTA